MQFESQPAPEILITSLTDSNSEIRRQALRQLFGVSIASENQETRRNGIQQSLETVAHQTPVEVSFFSETNNRLEGFLPENSTVLKQMLFGAELIVDVLSPEVRELFIKLVDYTRSFRDAMKQPGSYSRTDLSPENAAIIGAAQQIMVEFFGNYYGTSYLAKLSEQFYLNVEAPNEKGQISPVRKLSEFKGQNMAVCVEFATLGQELLSFAGLETQLIESSCDLEINGEGTLHAFNLVKADGSTFIYDPSNPIIEFDSTGQKIEKYMTYLAPLTAEQLNQLEKSYSVTIDYKGTRRAYSMRSAAEPPPEKLCP